MDGSPRAISEEVAEVISEYGRRTLPDGRVVVVYPLLFGRARLVVGPAEVEWTENEW